MKVNDLLLSTSFHVPTVNELLNSNKGNLKPVVNWCNSWKDILKEPLDAKK